MRSIFWLKLKFLGRIVLLFGLLNGLLFSCGEGIRLFPFPAAEVASQDKLEIKISGEDAYEKNLHRFENHSLSRHSKYQQNKDNHWLSSLNSFKNSPSENLVNLAKAKLSFQPDSITSHLFNQTISSRAPPLS
jgi:hypothetical protein